MLDLAKACLGWIRWALLILWYWVGTFWDMVRISSKTHENHEVTYKQEKVNYAVSEKENGVEVRQC